MAQYVRTIAALADEIREVSKNKLSEFESWTIAVAIHKQQLYARAQVIDTESDAGALETIASQLGAKPNGMGTDIVTAMDEIARSLTSIAENIGRE